MVNNSNTKFFLYLRILAVASYSEINKVKRVSGLGYCVIYICIISHLLFRL